MKEIFYLTLAGTPNGWSTLLDTPEDEGNPNPPYVRLSTNQSTNITLTVMVPWEGTTANAGVINVTVNSSVEPNNRDIVTTITIVNIWFDMGFTKEIENNTQSKYYGCKWDEMNACYPAYYDVFIENNGNFNDTFDLEIAPLPAGWDARFVETDDITANVSLCAKWYKSTGPCNATLTVKVTVPNLLVLSIDEIDLLTVSAKSRIVQFNDLLTKNDTLFLMPCQESLILYNCKEPQKELPAGGSTQFYIDIENRAPEETVLTFSHDGLMEGWSIEYYDCMNISEGGSVLFPVKVSAPADALGGDVSVISFYINDSRFKNFCGLTAVVSSYYDLMAYASSESAEGLPGSNAIFNVSLFNLGNAMDFAIFSVIGLPLGWNSSFTVGGNEVNSTYVEHGASLNLTFVAIPCLGETAGTYSLTLLFQGIGDSTAVYLTVNVIAPPEPAGEEGGSGGDDGGTGGDAPKNESPLSPPDLAFATAAFLRPESPEIDDNCVIWADIVNLGGVAAKNFTVLLYIDGSLEASTKVEVLNGSTVHHVSFPWRAQAGKHQAKIAIDPSDTVTEPNDQKRGQNNNVLVQKINIQNPEAANRSDNGWKGVSVLIAILVLVCTLAVAFIIIRKKNRNNKP